MKKILILTAVVIFCFVFTGCSDKYEKEKYDEELDIAVDTDPTSIAALEEEITKIAYKYDDGGILTHANIVFQGKTEIANKVGTIDFTFCRNDEESGRGTIVILTYNMATKKVEKMSYEQGNGMFTQTSSEPINEQVKLSPFTEIFKAIESDKAYANKLGGKNVKLTIECTSENMKITIL